MTLEKRRAPERCRPSGRLDHLLLGARLTSVSGDSHAVGVD